MTNSINVGILGASGYSGNELIKILVKHKNANIAFAQSKSNNGKRVNEIYNDSPVDVQYTDPTIDEINNADVVFLALPKDEATIIAKKITTAIIDLSPAHRFNPEYVYGLPEANRSQIKHADRIANPGCYATASILGILPIAKLKIDAIAFDTKSGYSGGGRANKYDYDENVIPYSLDGHYQKPEIGKFFSGKYTFAPHVVNAFRGLLSTIHVFGEIDGLAEKYRTFYQKEPFVKVVDDVPSFKMATGTPYCYVGGITESKGHAIVVSAIDNLLKGASSQAIQNMNIRFGFDEKDGLTE